MTKTLSELLKKYNVPGPRYTSYPTVPYWDHSPNPQTWLHMIQECQFETSQALGVYVHIPFCEKLCTYCGCNTRIHRNKDIAKRYIPLVLQEWQMYLNHLTAPIQIAELHLGGGTPTYLSPEECHDLISGILKNITIAKDFEFSIEVDPRVTSEEHLRTLVSLGFSRISLGVQDFDPTVQSLVNRIQSVEQVEKLTTIARQLGFQSINYDLIYGLPQQTIASIQMTMDHVIRLQPDRIAFYAYAHVPWIKASQRKFTEADLPTANDKRALYEHGRVLLEKAGYLEIGMDHFALPTDKLARAVHTQSLHRNFMGYTSQRTSPLIGLGVSSIGDSGYAFAQNEKVFELYEKKVNAGILPIYRGHILTAEDKVIRQHILNLMTQFYTTLDAALLTQIMPRLKELLEDELIYLENLKISIPPKGRPFLRNICMAFDLRLWKKIPETKLFSQTI